VLTPGALTVSLFVSVNVCPSTACSIVLAYAPTTTDSDLLASLVNLTAVNVLTLWPNNGTGVANVTVTIPPLTSSVGSLVASWKTATQTACSCADFAVMATTAATPAMAGTPATAAATNATAAASGGLMLFGFKGVILYSMIGGAGALVILLIAIVSKCVLRAMRADQCGSIR
jgi:hypothetical protein